MVIVYTEEKRSNKGTADVLPRQPEITTRLSDLDPLITNVNSSSIYGVSRVYPWLLKDWLKASAEFIFCVSINFPWEKKIEGCPKYRTAFWQEICDFTRL